MPGRTRVELSVPPKHSITMGLRSERKIKMDGQDYYRRRY